MNLTQLFHSYELLVDKADQAFLKMEQEHGECIKCERHCSDCCHAVFGLFLIEVAYLKQHFGKLDKSLMGSAFLMGDRADADFNKIEKKLQSHENDPQMRAYVLARERIRCPLLDKNQDCVLYPYRPITCRVYGIPTRIHGTARFCGKADFIEGKDYPVFDLDGVYRDLYALSKELLKSSGIADLEKASFLISISKTISTPLDILINEIFAQRGEDA